MTAVRRCAALAITVAALTLGGCASIVSGTTQKIAINTTPQGASCQLARQNQVIATAAPTPAQVEISKSRHDIEVKCELDGHLPAVARLNSDFQAMTLGNIIAGGLVGVAVDAGTGAMNKYEGTITVPLTPIGGRAPTGGGSRPVGAPVS